MSPSKSPAWIYVKIKLINYIYQNKIDLPSIGFLFEAGAALIKPAIATRTINLSILNFYSFFSNLFAKGWRYSSLI